MDSTTAVALLALGLGLALVFCGLLLWRLSTRPVLDRQGERLVPIPAPAPPPAIKCNIKHFIFERTDDTGAEVQADVWRHPHCDRLSLEELSDEFQAASFLNGHPGEGWQHTETRGEVHLVAP